MSGSKFILSAAVLGTLLGIGSASAADLPARTYTKAAPVVAPVATWTGFWVSGGFGYGMSEYQHSEYAAPPNGAFPVGTPLGLGEDTAGKGWLGKIGVGYDYQFMGNFVVGAFADTDWSNISGQGTNSLAGAPIVSLNQAGQYKNDYSWAVGGRVGYVALPGLLTYFNGGYTQAHFKGVNYVDNTVLFGGVAPGTPNGAVLGGQNRGGYFLGGGTEYAISQVPGLFWKNEVRFSEFGNKSNSIVCVSPGSTTCLNGAVLANQTSHVYEQRATTEFVYRFNWGGPVVAKY
jgi:outer membrane immunogenic protein